MMMRMMTVSFAMALAASTLLAADAPKPVYAWDFDRDDGKGHAANVGSGSHETVLYVSEMRAGQGVGCSAACFVGKDDKEPTQRPLLPLKWKAYTFDLSFSVDAVPTGRAPAKTLLQYMWAIYHRGEVKLAIVPDGRLEVSFTRRSKDPALNVEKRYTSGECAIRPGVFHAVRLTGAENGDMRLYLDGVEVLRAAGTPGLLGVDAEPPKWYPLLRLGADASDPEHPKDFLGGLLDDVRLYNVALGAPEIILPKTAADYSGVAAPQFRAVAGGEVDMLILDEKGCGKTGPFRVLDREGELAGSLYHADEKFVRNAAKAKFSVDEKEIRVTIACGVPDGMAVEEKPATVFNGDEVEFFIRPSLEKDEYFQYCVNAVGLSEAIRHPSVGTSDPAFKSRFTHDCRRAKDGYLVTMTIPREEVFARSPTAGDAFSVNFTRIGKTAGGLSTWAAVGRTFNNPSLFGRVVFGGPKAYFARRVAAEKEAASLRFPAKEQAAAAEKALGAVERAVAEHGADPAAFVALEKMFANLSRTFLQIALEGRRLLVYRPSNPWSDAIAPDADTAPLVKLVFAAPLNAKVRVPFALANFTDRNFIGQVKFFNRDPATRFYWEDCPGIARKITLFETIPTETDSGSYRQDLLSPAPLNTLVRVPAHGNVLYWAELDTHGVKPGRHFAKMVVKRGAKDFEETTTVPVEITVTPADMDTVKLDRAEYTQIQSHHPDCPRLLKGLADRGVNVFLTNTPGYDGFKISPRFGKDGKMTKADMSDLDEKVDAILASGVRREDLWIWFNQALLYNWCSILQRDGKAMAPFGSPEWHEWLEAVLVQTSDHLKEKYGIGRDRFICYTVDEPDGDIDDPKLESSMSKAYYAAKAIKKIDPAFVTFTDPSPFIYPKFDVFKRDFDKLATCYDIIELYRPHVRPEHVAHVKKLGFKRIWTYSILGVAAPVLPFRADFWYNLRDGFEPIATQWHYEEMNGGDGIDPYGTVNEASTDWGANYVDFDNDLGLGSRRQMAQDMGWEEARLVLWLRNRFKGDTKRLAEIERIVRDAADRRDMGALDEATAQLLGMTAETEPPAAAKRELFDGKTLKGWYKFLKGRGRDNDPKNVITVKDGVIRITGEEFGALVSEEEFADYRLDVEYRWNGLSYGFKSKWAPDSGILFHSTGPDGAFDGAWMHSIECNIIKGATGDFWTVGATNRLDVFLEGEADPGQRLTCSYGTFPIWQEGGDKVRFTGNGRLCRRDIRMNWTDTPDVAIASGERPMGEWNTVTLECCGETVSVWFNGELVNKATKVSPTKGKIQLQSEGWGIEFRRVTLTPLATEG